MTHLETWLQTPLAQAAGWTLFHSLWEGVVVAVILAAVLKTIRSSGARYAAACIAMCAILVCFAGTLIALAPSHQGPSALHSVMPLDWSNGVAFDDTPTASMRGIADVLPWLVPFWIAGVVLFYLRHLAGWAWTLRLRRSGVCCASDLWTERLKLLATRLGIARRVALLESCLAGVPVVIGHLRPVILMPVGLLAGMPAGQIESILLHELAHIRRHDYLINMLQSLVEGLLFYHPLVWWISGVIRAEREHCCDDVAVAVSGDAYRYVSALAALEETRWSASQAALAATGGNLVKRIRRLLIPIEGPGSALTPLVSAAILIITAAVGLTAWQAKAPASPQGQESDNATQNLADLRQKLTYGKWLNEDVVYIITREERAAFMKLETNEEREEFIKQFWLRRDPTPDTPKNEFKEEHYRRIAQANLRFPTATGKAGWKTDRGRIYILYGPPDEIDDRSSPGSYNRPENGAAPNGPHSFPYVDWTYRYIDGVGTNVMIEFIDPSGTHDFRMTSDPDPKAGVEKPNSQ